MTASFISLSNSPLSIEAKKIGSNKRQLVLNEMVDTSEYGRVVDMSTFTTGGQELICYATSMGKLCGLDLRSCSAAWELTNDAKFGQCLINYERE